MAHNEYISQRLVGGFIKTESQLLMPSVVGPCGRTRFKEEPMQGETMNIAKNMSRGMLEFIGSSLWGFKPNLMKDIVDQNGGFSSVTWFARNMPAYERILKEWGPIRTHLLASEISVLNGCPYCTYGHIYALQLHYLQQHDILMTASEDQFVSWHSLDEKEKIKQIRGFIEENDLSSEMALFDRMLELKAGANTTDSKEDKNIAHLIQMFAYLNQCGIVGKTESDQAHDPINQDEPLKARYAQLRGGSSVSA